MNDKYKIYPVELSYKMNPKPITMPKHVRKIIDMLESSDHNALTRYIVDNDIDKSEYEYWKHCRDPLSFEFFKTNLIDIEELCTIIIEDDNIDMFKYLQKKYDTIHKKIEKYMYGSLMHNSVKIVRHIIESIEFYISDLPFYENLKYESVCILHEYKNKISARSVNSMIANMKHHPFVEGTDPTILNLLAEMIIDLKMECEICLPIELCATLISKGIAFKSCQDWPVDYLDYIDHVNEEHFMKLLGLIIEDFTELHFTHDLIEKGLTNTINYIMDKTKFMIKFNLASSCNIPASLLQKIKDEGRLQVFWEGDAIERFTNDVQNVIKSLIKIDDLDEDLWNESGNKILIDM
ncbi:hypothetical protein D3C87_1226030 [compost metagenome]